MKKRLVFILLICLSTYAALAQKGSKERIKIYSAAIDGNLIGDPAEREVTVYLPPSYQSNPENDILSFTCFMALLIPIHNGLVGKTIG
ncbi:hypothetical protein [Cecembia calidifontis]|uniref:Uncharacterized protein n=1 Tax=Cecembia calidifontis TaxID=1187080 RepID=A0A4Q7P6U8_9BACT|nr:hypothetical protein [Cecembia calidifontis]RZS95248.1 hypothetical protein BC751_0767 [Cecembia calidifontis]